MARKKLTWQELMDIEKLETAHYDELHTLATEYSTLCNFRYILCYNRVPDSVFYGGKNLWVLHHYLFSPIILGETWEQAKKSLEDKLHERKYNLGLIPR